MGRKDPFKTIKINVVIYDALVARRVKDSAGEFKLPSMNEYIERVLWKYVHSETIPDDQ